MALWTPAFNYPLGTLLYHHQLTHTCVYLYTRTHLHTACLFLCSLSQKMQPPSIQFPNAESCKFFLILKKTFLTSPFTYLNLLKTLSTYLPSPLHPQCSFPVSGYFLLPRFLQRPLSSFCFLTYCPLAHSPHAARMMFLKDK